MALILRFEHKARARNTKHGAIDATYATFMQDNQTYLQINSFGTKTRKHLTIASQKFQFDRSSAQELYNILKKTFDF